MKEYKLVSWSELPAPYNRTAYRRALNAMSQRFAGVTRLAQASGLSRAEVREFLDLLDSRGALQERQRAANDSVFDGLRPLGGWLRRTFSAEPQRP